MFSQPSKQPAKRLGSRARMGLLAMLFLAGIAGTVFFGRNWSVLAVDLANPLRALIGNRGVARLETVLFNLQDQFHQWEYRSGRKPAAPWQADVTTPASPIPSHAPATTPPIRAAALNGTAVPTATITAPISGTLEPASTREATFPPTPTATDWFPAAAPALGTVAGEGTWTPYLQDASGRTVAARTFLQPDPDRPFAYVAVVAFDLSAVRLNFVIGFDEPSEKGGPKGKGVIPEADLQAGRLLAIFNGGFQSAHGSFGAMQDSFTPLPPQDDIATVAMYRDGRVQIGAWRQDLEWSSDMVSFRQNCPMVVHNGAINPQVYNNSTVDWGGTVQNAIATWRSGLGLSADGQTLYYYVGPSLSMTALADAMLASGAHNSMLLDINAFWVHFVAIRSDGDAFVSEPLLPKDMGHKVDRYLQPFPRDFFYITSKK